MRLNRAAFLRWFARQDPFRYFGVSNGWIPSYSACPIATWLREELGHTEGYVCTTNYALTEDGWATPCLPWMTLAQRAFFKAEDTDTIHLWATLPESWTKTVTPSWEEML